MPPEIVECEQGGLEWRQARLGIPTASEFHSIMAKGKGDAESKMRRTYMLKLIGEILTGQPSDQFENRHTQRGTEQEPEAIACYEFLKDVKVQRVGFMKNFGVGYSPDGLVGDSGLIEGKAKLPHIHLAAYLDDELPTEHKWQCQGGLWVAEREWLDFISYSPPIPTFIKRIVRNEQDIKLLKEGCDKFLEDMQNLIEKIKSHGG